MSWQKGAAQEPKSCAEKLGGSCELEFEESGQESISELRVSQVRRSLRSAPCSTRCEARPRPTTWTATAVAGSCLQALSQELLALDFLEVERFGGVVYAVRWPRTVRGLAIETMKR